MSLPIQKAINAAIEKNQTIYMLCSLSNEKIRESITDGKNCHIFWEKEGHSIFIILPNAWQNNPKHPGGYSKEDSHCLSSL